MAVNTVPTSTGIGAPGTAPAPANLARSPMSSAPAAPAAIPFTRGSSLATMKDASVTFSTGQTQQIGLQTNAFLESIIIDVKVSTGGGSTTAVYTYDAPFNAISSIKLDDPAGQSIMAPITGFGLAMLNKYLTDTDCAFDPLKDPNFAVPSSGLFTFRLVVPVEHRRRDAFCALNNSAANQRYLLTITANSSFSNNAAYDPNYIFQAGPGTAVTQLTASVYQQYWTSPPSVIQTSAGSTAVQATPAGLGSVAFVRYERHNEVSGGGSSQIQLNNVGDYISTLIFILRGTDGSSVANNRDSADWPAEFDWWVNDFQVHAISTNDFNRWMARFHGIVSAVGATAVTTAYAAPGVSTALRAGYLDAGVYTLDWLVGLFDKNFNFAPANQYLPTDATTKLQIRGSTWGNTFTSQYLEVYSRLVRPVSGAALFS